MTTQDSVYETAVFDGEYGVETFETGWGASSSLSLTPDELELATFSTQDVETFDRDWGPFEGAKARLPSGAVEPFALFDGATIELVIDGGSTQTITFNTAHFVDIAGATAAEVVARMDAVASDADFSVYAEGRVLVESQNEASTTPLDVSTVRVLPTSTATALGFSTATQEPFLTPRVAVGSGHPENSKSDGVLTLLEAATFTQGTLPVTSVEDFEAGWGGNETFTTPEDSLFPGDVANNSLAASEFNTTDDDFEGFDREWSGNESFIVPSNDIFPGGSLSAAASFNNAGVLVDHESFSPLRAAQAVFRILTAEVGGTYVLGVNGLTAEYTAIAGDNVNDIAQELATRITNPAREVTGTFAGSSGRTDIFVDGPAAFDIMTINGPTSAHVLDETAERKDIEWLSPLFGA